MTSKTSITMLSLLLIVSGVLQAFVKNFSLLIGLYSLAVICALIMSIDSLIEDKKVAKFTKGFYKPFPGSYVLWGMTIMMVALAITRIILTKFS